MQRLETASSLLATGAAQPDVEKQLTWVVIGGGPTGVELTAELTDFINQDVKKYFPTLAGKIKVILIEAFPRVLGMFEEHMSNYATDSLKQSGAEVRLNTMVTSISKDAVALKVKDEPSPVSIPYGAIIWAGGIAMRPVTRAIITQFPGQSSRFGIEVDAKMRVKGCTDGSVWAIGDCAVTGCAPTAQAASQQGKYLGALFRKTQLEPPLIEAFPEFVFVYKGALAYVGSSRGIAELKNLWDVYPVNGQVKVEGASAFAIWRSLYFSKLLSGRNQSQVIMNFLIIDHLTILVKDHFQVAFDWLKNWVFGRDIATPPPNKAQNETS